MMQLSLHLALAETWTEVWGDEVSALAPKKIFCRPQKCDIWGGDSLCSWISIFNPL